MECLLHFALRWEGYQCIKPSVGSVVVIVEEVVPWVKEELPQFYFWGST